MGAFAAVSLVAQFGLLFSAASVVRLYFTFLVKYENEPLVLSKHYWLSFLFHLYKFSWFLAFEIANVNLELNVFLGIEAILSLLYF